MNAKSQVALLSVASNIVLVAFKLAVGTIIGSVSVISEAIHSGLDLLAALLAFFSVRESAKPADEVHNYGHGKIENVSGTIEALLIFVAAIWIIAEAVQKLSSPAPLENTYWGVLVMGVAASVNFLVSSKLFKVAKATDSVALEADALHLRTDVYTSLGVAAGLLLIWITGIDLLDPLIALAVALAIIHAAYELTKEAFLPLVDISLPQAEEDLIRDAIEDHAPHYVEYHKLRSRKAGSTRYIDLHLVVPADVHINKAHNFAHHVVGDIEQRLDNTQVLIHLEPCDNLCEHCCGTEECDGAEGKSRK